MNPEIVPIHRKESLREDGMLFVRTEGILETMVKAPLIIAGLVVVAANECQFRPHSVLLVCLI